GPEVEPKLSPSMVTANVILTLEMAVMMSRDQRMADQGYVGEAPLRDEHGQFFLQHTGYFFYDYSKNYVSGEFSGINLPITREKYFQLTALAAKAFGYYDWKGDFVQGEFEPM